MKRKIEDGCLVGRCGNVWEGGREGRSEVRKERKGMKGGMSRRRVK